MNDKTFIDVKVRTINIPTDNLLNIQQVRPECPVGARLVMLNFTRIPVGVNLSYAFGQENSSLAFQGSGWDFSQPDPCIDAAMADGLFLGTTGVVAGDFIQVQLVFAQGGALPILSQ